MSDPATPQQYLTFGPAEDGVYITPYQFTVIYDSSDPLAVALATMCPRAQLLDLATTGSTFDLANCCPHPSPEVFLVGIGRGDQVSEEELKGFVARGSTKIHCMTVLAASTPTTTPKYALDCVTEFGYDDVFKHIPFEGGMIDLYLVEYAAVANGAKSKFTEVTKERADHFLRYIGFKGRDLGDEIKRISGHIMGFDEIEKIISKGQLLTEIMDWAVERAVSNGVTIELGGEPAHVIMTDENPYVIWKAVIDRGIEHEYVIVCNFKALMSNNNTAVPGWDIHLFAGETKMAASDVMRKLTPVRKDISEEYWSDEHAHAWVMTKDAHGILPHLYLEVS